MPDTKPEWVRVRLANGSEATVSSAFAKRHDLTPLDKPATKNGRPLPTKHNPLKKSGTAKEQDTNTAKKSAAKPATTTKKKSAAKPATTTKKES